MEGPILAEHKLDLGKGHLIKLSEHNRDKSKGIDAFIKSISSDFTDEKLAQDFLEQVRKRYPRYIRDQLQIIANTNQEIDQILRDKTLQECIDRKLYGATDFKDMANYLARYQPVQLFKQEKIETQQSIKNIKPQVRDIKTYISLLKGESI